MLFMFIFPCLHKSIDKLGTKNNNAHLAAREELLADKAEQAFGQVQSLRACMQKKVKMCVR